MVCKTAVIASDVGGNRELITNHKNGILLEPKNTELFIKSINELFENSEKRQSMINESNQLIKNYDWSKVGNLYMDIYKNLLKQNTD